MKDAKPKLIVRALRAEGFVENGGTKHLKMVKVVDGRTVTVHVQQHGIIKRNTVEAIRKNAGLGKDFYIKHKF